MNAAEIRRTFLEFFRSKGHEIVPSAPMVVKDDPTLMFNNSGMAPFKDWFLGNTPAKWPRVADTQKCLRVSGKHNDLEEVGVDTYHHTMFEMLGNWSFGDYFKKEALAWSWELLTEVYKLPKDRLYVTVFEGSADDNLGFDQDAYDVWRQFLPEDRILRGNKKDNFWEMGDTGPCGPCSEIHFDSRPDSEREKVPGHTLVNADHPQVIEIWNNVFMEFNRRWKQNGGAAELTAFERTFKGSEADKKKAAAKKHSELTVLEALPARHVDTGMGFERLVRVIQQKSSNYDTDVFQPLISMIGVMTNNKYTGTDSKQDIAFRVLADHIRTISFAIADGQLPSNTGAGYVIRRILRRAVRYYYSFLNQKEPLLCNIVPTLATEMGEFFPELRDQRALIMAVIEEEEKAFLRTLAGGIVRFEEYVKKNPGKTIDGAFAFELYDTFGFPIDLTNLLARENNVAVDMDGFETNLQAQKERSRAATAIDTDEWVELIKEAQPKFIGYTDLTSETRIVRYRRIKAKGKESYQLVLETTPFYAESGGQVGDTGWLESANERVRIMDTKKENGVTVHFAERLPEDVSRTFTATIDSAVRKATENNHSATHLLHAALRSVLGTHVEQKGSLVNGEYLRFDFSHFSKVSEEEIAAIEKMVNEKVRQNIAADIREMAIDEAKAQGAMALFGEKYGDLVRVVTFDKNYSIELCGGTHVPATGQIGLFKITSEAAVAAGVRRIEAITATSAENFMNEQLRLVREAREILKNPKDLLKSIQSLIDEKKALEQEVEKMQRAKAQLLKGELLAKAESINGITFIAAQVELNSADAIKDLAYEIRTQVGDNLFLVLGAEVNSKASLTLMLSDNLVKDKGMNAGQIIRDLAKEIQGGGGGQPFFATSGGANVAGIPAALSKAKTVLG
ncbi:MAG: alanine--tRNA ligase [Bacteroidetes bacterium]|nr:alanine--tRNA ligase [Bacteroidota bacterium]